MTFKAVRAHIFSSDFWRVVVLVGKRLLSAIKVFAKLPFVCLPLLYVLHLVRAGLRVISYFRRTKNRNLGETRKLVFSLFKIAIAIAALVCIFFLGTIPPALLTAFLIYSLIKLVDSTIVLCYSFAAHLKLDKQLPENQWRRQNYWDNIVKHLSILGIGVSMTLLTAVVLVVSVGSAVAVIWVNPVVLLCLIITAVVTLAAVVYLSGLAYQQHQVRDGLETLKREHIASIRSFLKLFGLWIFSLVAVFTVIAVSVLCPPTLAVSLGLAAAVLSVFGLIDAIKSTYDYFFSGKVAEPLPAGLIPKNSWEKTAENDYYYRKNRSLYLSLACDQAAVQANTVFIAKEALVKCLALSSRPYSRWTKPMLEEKKMAVVGGMASVFATTDATQVLNDTFIDVVIQAIISLHEDRDSLLETVKKEEGQSVCKKQEILLDHNLRVLVKYLLEALDVVRDFPDANENSTHGDNYLVDCWIRAKNNTMETQSCRSLHAFLKHTSDTKDFVDACYQDTKIKKDAAKVTLKEATEKEEGAAEIFQREARDCAMSCRK